MLRTPKVSVVIPLFNKEPEIRRAIDSVLRQTMDAFELIVVDDGSTDSGPTVVRQMRDTRIRLITQRNAGECAARNSGISASRAELIAFLDADDEWYPGFLKKIIELREVYPEAGVYGTSFCISKGRGLLHKCRQSSLPSGPWSGLVPNYYATRNAFCASSVAVCKTAFQKVNGFQPGVKMGGDLDMWFRLAAYFPIACSSDVLATWHIDASNRVCRSYAPEVSTALARSLAQIDGDAGVSPAAKAAAREYVRTKQYEDVVAWCRQNCFEEANRILRQLRRENGTTPKWLTHKLLTIAPSSLIQLATRTRLLAVKSLLHALRWQRHLCGDPAWYSCK